MTATTIQYIGGPTAVIEIGGLRLLTDPTFDAPGVYPVGEWALVKAVGPAIAAEGVEAVDAVLLSHDQHPDNFDVAGAAYLSQVPLTLSTRSARQRVGGRVQALAHWAQTELLRPDGRPLRITGVPAQHGPAGSEPIVGEVVGFVLSGEGVPTVYVSGDNASLDVVREITERCGPFDVVVLFAGAAQAPFIPGADLTLGSEHAAEAAAILGAPHVVPLHFEHWSHLTQGRETLVEAFERAGLSDRLHLLDPGQSTEDLGGKS
ncbi:MBL fold metallo-hydrolase [Streptomyces sp. NPDC006733]|uniref:MBL fold metallo-hydrolase n=1 Tax=Streptomyces sp. NPDC006733 TaxID=3155460 RepID=UPI0033C77FC6